MRERFYWLCKGEKRCGAAKMANRPSTRSHPLARKNEAVWYDCVALIRTAVTFIRLSPNNDRDILQGAHLQFTEGFHNMNLLKETNIPFVEN